MANHRDMMTHTDNQLSDVSGVPVSGVPNATLGRSKVEAAAEEAVHETELAHKRDESGNQSGNQSASEPSQAGETQ